MFSNFTTILFLVIIGLIFILISLFSETILENVFRILYPRKSNTDDYQINRQIKILEEKLEKLEALMDSKPEDLLKSK